MEKIPVERPFNWLALEEVRALVPGNLRIWFFRGEPKNPFYLEPPKWVHERQIEQDPQSALSLAWRLAEEAEQRKTFNGVILVDHKGRVAAFIDCDQAVIDPQSLRLEKEKARD